MKSTDLTEAQLSEAAAALGRRGGKAGTGDSKRRGDAQHYASLTADYRKKKAKKKKK